MNFTTPEPIIENSEGVFTFVMNNSGECSYTNLYLFRNRRNWGYLGWNWGPVFGWGDWYWDKIIPSGSGSFWKSASDKSYTYTVTITEDKDHNSWGVEFTNEFQLKFYNTELVFPFKDLECLYTYAVGLVNNENVFNIYWRDNNTVVVTRTY